MTSYIPIIIEIYNSLSNRSRIRLNIVILLSLVWAVIDVLVVYYVVEFIPLISSLSQPQSGTTHLAIVSKSFLLGLLVLSASAYRVFIVWVTNKTASKVSAEYIQEAVARYLKCSYMKFISIDPSLSLNILGSSSSLFFSVCKNIISLSYYFSSVLLVLLLLLLKSPIAGFLALLITTIPYLLIYRRSRTAHSSLANSIDSAQKRILRSLSDLIKEFKLIRTLRVYDDYIHSFAYNDTHVRSLYAESDFRETVPRYIFEGVAGFLIALVISLSLYYRAYGVIDSLLIVAVASQRVLPSAQQIYRITTHLKTFGYILTKISYFYNLPDSIGTIPSSTTTSGELSVSEDRRQPISVGVNNVSFSFASELNSVITNASLSVSAGDIVGITAPSGAGKTTFLDLICGLLVPTSGTISYEGISPNRVCYIPQASHLLRGTLLYNITLSSSSDYNREFFDQAIQVSCLEDLISRLPNGILSKVGEGYQPLSGGEIKRIAIARAIYKNPQLLVLDEATAGIQVDLELKIMKSISRLKSEMIVFVVSHSQASFTYCTHLLSFSRGQCPAFRAISHQ